LGWLRGTTRLTTIPTSNIDEYSEDTNSQFEPREDHKGNLARAAFYFYTMHANESFDAGKDVITALSDLLRCTAGTSPTPWTPARLSATTA
jgi:hypothetical protein